MCLTARQEENKLKTDLMKQLADCMEEIRKMHAQPQDPEADRKKIEELTRRIGELEEALKREQQKAEEERAKLQSSAEEQAGRLKQAREENEGLKKRLEVSAHWCVTFVCFLLHHNSKR